MASGGERPDLDALRELEEVLRHLETELAGWRRRALSAEARLGESAPGGEAQPGSKDLESRLAGAKALVGDILERLRFLEQQRGNGENGQ